jgi:hypothetical protein
VCKNEGDKLGSCRSELNLLTRQLDTPKLLDLAPPHISPRRQVSAERLEAVNNHLLKIVTSDALPLVQRLIWLTRFVSHLDRIKWKNVSDSDLPELLNMFRGGILAELQQLSSSPPDSAPTGKSRKLLGQIFFLLCQPTADLPGSDEKLFKKIKHRIATTHDLKKLAQTSGPLPKIQPDWPECDLTELERSFGPWPIEIEQMLTRYLACRLAGYGYFGPNFYNFSLTEGLRTLLLGMVTIGWVMRIYAVKQNRHTLELDNAYNAVITIDGNLGYSSALAFGPARLRLQYLSDNLEDFIYYYCT